jgi:tetratricopeptide (TPR) repeat protein
MFVVVCFVAHRLAVSAVRLRIDRGLIALFAAACVVVGAVAAREVDALEQAVAADPENLMLAADYRQRAIADAVFDRSIGFLEKLAKRKGSGPHVQISLALAYVDKVPTSGDIRRLYLGRDAMSALTKAIEQQPSVLPYYMRGVINLYYNSFIFHRIPRGIADLQQALALVAPETPPALVARVHLSLGDAYWRLGDREKARDAWSRGSERYPQDSAFKTRLVTDARAIEDAVTTALYAGTRVDTTLRGLLVAGY